MKVQRVTWVLALQAVVWGCGPAPKPTADEEACEHLKNGPAASVTATAASSGAPAIKSDHKRYDVTFVDITGGKGGYVTYAAAEKGDYLFFFDRAAPVKFFDGSNKEVAPERSESSSTSCAEVMARHTVPLEVGTYSLSFGPTTETSVKIVVEQNAHAEH